MRGGEGLRALELELGRGVDTRALEEQTCKQLPAILCQVGICLLLSESDR